MFLYLIGGYSGLTLAYFTPYNLLISRGWEVKKLRFPETLEAQVLCVIWVLPIRCTYVKPRRWKGV